MFRWLNGCRGPRLLLVLACASSCHWTVAAAQARRDSTATLVVQVMDTAETPVPLADVILRRAGMRATSGATGRVTLRDIPPGLDTLLVRRLGYDPLIVAVRFFAGNALTVEAVLEARLVALEEIEVVARAGRWLGAEQGVGATHSVARGPDVPGTAGNRWRGRRAA